MKHTKILELLDQDENRNLNEGKMTDEKATKAAIGNLKFMRKLIADAEKELAKGNTQDSFVTAVGAMVRIRDEDWFGHFFG